MVLLLFILSSVCATISANSLQLTNLNDPNVLKSMQNTDIRDAKCTTKYCQYKIVASGPRQFEVLVNASLGTVLPSIGRIEFTEFYDDEPIVTGHTLELNLFFSGNILQVKNTDVGVYRGDLIVERKADGEDYAFWCPMLYPDVLSYGPRVCMEYTCDAEDNCKLKMVESKKKMFFVFSQQGDVIFLENGSYKFVNEDRMAKSYYA